MKNNGDFSFRKSPKPGSAQLRAGPFFIPSPSALRLSPRGFFFAPSPHSVQIYVTFPPSFLYTPSKLYSVFGHLFSFFFLYNLSLPGAPKPAPVFRKRCARAYPPSPLSLPFKNLSGCSHEPSRKDLSAAFKSFYRLSPKAFRRLLHMLLFRYSGSEVAFRVRFLRPVQEHPLPAPKRI